MTMEDGYGAAFAMNADIKSRFRAGAKVCSGVIIAMLVIAALGPAKWAPRTELGWQFDHFIGYFGITLFFCFAWPRPLVIGGIVMARRGVARRLASSDAGSIGQSRGWTLG